MQIKRTARLLMDPASMIFGVAVFNLILVWLHPLEWDFHRNIFVAVLLLASSILVLMNTSWSNLLAAIVSGYLPIETLWAFCMLAHHAEVPALSYRHFSYFFRGIEIEGGGLLFPALTLMLLARAVFAVLQNRAR